MKRAQLLLLTIITLLFCVTYSGADSSNVASSYIDPKYFTSLPFGTYSHWLQPWRSYLETVPATQFLNGIGTNFNVGNTNPDLVATMLAKHGVRRGRIEISWSELNFDDETRINNEVTHRAILKALQSQGIRPLILLNGNHGLPCPAISSERIVTAAANTGATELQLNDTSGLKAGYSGLSNLSEFWAAEVIFTEINGNTVKLSKPLPKTIAEATPVPITTLKYRPFSPPNTPDYNATMAGWLRYVGAVANFAADALGTRQDNDKGFDLEIWNELSFGSNFLYVNAYYDPKPFKYAEDEVWDNIVNQTAAYVDANVELFAGVNIANGFGNTVPWIASSKQPARINAISKHPYAGRKRYPGDEDKNNPVDALFQPYDKSTFSPDYSVLFPEYFATALQTETIVRDMGPITSDIYGTQHGRNTRKNGDRIIPTPIWITEVNIAPNEFDPNITVDRALAVKAKTTARYLTFYLNKGATEVDLYAAVEADRGLGIVKEDFIAYAVQPGVPYPVDDSLYVSPTLKTIQRMVAQMSRDHDPTFTEPRPLAVESIRDTHNHYQFQGDGSPARPTLYNRELFTFLPYQVNAKRFVIPYYIMTRDILNDMKPEQYTVIVKGLRAAGTTITAYDPIQNKNLPVKVTQSDNSQSSPQSSPQSHSQSAAHQDTSSLTLELTATDYPYLLIVDEA